MEKKFKWIKPEGGVLFNQGVKDQTTGFEGIVHAKCSYRTGCVHVEVQPTTLDNSKIRKSEWIDESLLDVQVEIEDKPKQESPRPKYYFSGSRGGTHDSPPEPSRPSMSRPEINGKREEHDSRD